MWPNGGVSAPSGLSLVQFIVSLKGSGDFFMAIRWKCVLLQATRSPFGSHSDV
jgi:hypothetical protein